MVHYIAGSFLHLPYYPTRIYVSLSITERLDFSLDESLTLGCSTEDRCP
jgi:hypothetical protein